MYDQLDAMPVFYSLAMVFNILCGLFLLGESPRYGTGRLIGIWIAVIICVIGIFILGYKKNYIANEEAKKDEALAAQDPDLAENLESAPSIMDNLDKHALKMIKLLAVSSIDTEEKKDPEATSEVQREESEMAQANGPSTTGSLNNDDDEDGLIKEEDLAVL